MVYTDQNKYDVGHVVSLEPAILVMFVLLEIWVLSKPCKIKVFKYFYTELSSIFAVLKKSKIKYMQTTVENILNVTLLEPRQKHPTIFVRFDELEEGESLTIHNDHDPKPLY